MALPALGSVLLGTADPDRLRGWYLEAFAPPVDKYGFLVFGPVKVLIDRRADVAVKNPEPGRVILNLSVDDARAVAAHLDRVGVTWLAGLEEREHGLFGTLVDPDGNYVQIIQLNQDYYDDSLTG
jgi:hypothetical protein